jgi:hypothetical protein
MRTSVVAFCLCVGLAGTAPAQDSLYFRRVGRWGSSQLTGVAVKGTYAYVVGLSDDQYDGLHVLSLADIAHPEEVWRCSTMALALDVAVSGEHLYCADYPAGLRVFSISDPTHPDEVGRCSTAWTASVAVSGDYAYATSDSGLSVISIADPSHPVEVGYCRSPGGWHSWSTVEVVGDYAYVAARGGGLRVISVADPTNPVEVGCYEPGPVTGVAVRDSYAYVGCEGSFRVVSVADPSSPVEVGALDSAAFTGWGTVLTRGYALTAAGINSGLWAISVSDPTHPTLAGYYGGRFGWYSLVVHGDYVYYAGFGLRIYQFYQLGDLDVDNDSLDVVADTLRLRRWATGSGDSLECALGEFVLANTSTSYNPDSIDGPSVSPIDSLSFMGSLTGPGGTIDSILIPNLPASLAQGQTLVSTLAAYLPAGLKVGDYSGSIYISGKDTAGLMVYESCYVFLQKLGDIDVDNDSLDVIADTVRLTNLGSETIGEFILANTSASYNPDTSDGPSRSPIDSLSFAGSLTGQSGTIDSILIPNLPQSLARGQAIVCTLAVYVPPELRDGDYAGSITITGKDSVGAPIQETFSALVKNVLGDLDVDDDSLGVVRDTMNVRVQPVYMPSGMARFMLVNTSSSYNPDAEDGPSYSPLRAVKVEAKVTTGDSPRAGTVPCSVYVLNLPESLAVGQAVECTLALVIPVGESLDNYFGMVTINALDTLGYQVRDSFFLVVRGPQPRENLASFMVVPIPFKPNQNPEHDAIHFQGLTAGARVIVYDASGQSVWGATEAGDGHLKWDAKVASGIYVYLVVAKDGQSRVGKLPVIR